MSDYDSSDDELEDDVEMGEMELDTVEESSGPTSYRLSGEKGDAPATINGRNAAIAHFNDFMATKQLPNFYEASEKQLCTRSIWQEYGTYLSEFAKTKNKVRQHRYSDIYMHS